MCMFPHAGSAFDSTNIKYNSGRNNSSKGSGIGIGLIIGCVVVVAVIGVLVALNQQVRCSIEIEAALVPINATYTLLFVHVYLRVYVCTACPLPSLSFFIYYYTIRVGWVTLHRLFSSLSLSKQSAHHRFAFYFSQFFSWDVAGLNLSPFCIVVGSRQAKATTREESLEGRRLWRRFKPNRPSTSVLFFKRRKKTG